MRRLPGLALALVAAACAPKAPATAPVAPPAAEVRVPGPADAVALSLPATPHAAFNAFLRVLEAVDARYVLEGPAADPARPAFDLAADRTGVLTLGGRPLGEALDAIAGAAPGFRWRDAGGLFVIRASADGEGILDRRIRRFRLPAASPRTALDAVMVALDPRRRWAEGIVPAAQPRLSRTVALSRDGASVEEILVAIARAHGDLAWTIRYDRAPAGVDTATFSVTSSGLVVRGLSNAAMAEQADPAWAWRRLSISPPLASMLFSYAGRTGTRVHIEEAAETVNRTVGATLASGLPALELPADPAEAVALIVSLDSRYEWEQRDGRFLVRPKPGVAGRLALLDRPLGPFEAAGEPAGRVLERLAEAIGPVRPGPGSTVGVTPAAAEASMARPISVRVDAAATIRDALDAVADATGWMWSLQPRLAPGAPPGLTLAWHGRTEPAGGRAADRPPGPLGGAGAWTRSFAFTSPAGLMPEAAAGPLAPARGAPLPAVTLPIPALPPGAQPDPPRPPPAPDTPPIRLERPVTSRSLRFALGLAARANGVLLGLEVVAEGTPPAPGPVRDYADLTGLSMDDTMAIIGNLAPDYVASVANGVYRLRPREAQRDSTPWLDLTVDRFDHRFDRIEDAMSAVAALAWSAAASAGRPRPPVQGTPPPPRPVALALAGVTVRDILDALVREAGAASWVVEQRVATSGPLVRLTIAGDGWSLTTTVR